MKVVHITLIVVVVFVLHLGSAIDEKSSRAKSREDRAVPLVVAGLLESETITAFLTGGLAALGRYLSPQVVRALSKNDKVVAGAAAAIAALNAGNFKDEADESSPPKIELVLFDDEPLVEYKLENPTKAADNQNSARAGTSGTSRHIQAQSSTYDAASSFTSAHRRPSSGASGQPPTPPPNFTERPTPSSKIYFPPDKDATTSSDNSNEIALLDDTIPILEVDIPEDLTEFRYARFVTLARHQFGVTYSGDWEAEDEISFEDSLVRPAALDEPLSVLARDGPTQVQGLTWHTPRFINCCNFDFFLTYVAVRQKKQPHFARRYFKKNSPAESALESIFQTFSRTERTNEFRSEKIKNTWLNVVPGIVNRYPEPTNALSIASETINGPLRESCGVVLIRICPCKDKETGSVKATAHRQLGLTADSADAIRVISTNTGDLDKLDGLILHTKQAGKCGSCNRRRLVPLYFVSSATWFVTISVTSDVNYRWSNLNLPPSIRINQVERPNSAVEFDLSIIQFTTQAGSILHSTAFFIFGSTWYYYDDMRSDGRFFIVPRTQVDMFIARKKLNWHKIYYFRR